MDAGWLPLTLLLAAQPEPATSVLQLVQRMVTRRLLNRAGLKADDGQGGAVALIRRLGSAANLNASVAQDRIVEPARTASGRPHAGLETPGVLRA
jgi:hypothetical protein